MRYVLFSSYHYQAAENDIYHTNVITTKDDIGLDLSNDRKRRRD